MKQLPDPLSRHAREQPDRAALVHRERVWSYAELDADTARIAGALRRRGVRAGDRVALVLRGGPLHVLLIHALPRLGATAILLDPRLTAAELRPLLALGSPKLLIHTLDHHDVVGAALRKRPELDCLSDEELRRTASRSPALPRCALELDRDHSVLLTSGTTGHAKGVRLSLRNHLASALASAQRLGVCADDRWLLCVPLHHVAGLAVVLRSALQGTTIVLHDGFAPDVVWQSLLEQRVRTISLVPTMLARLLATHEGTPPAALRFALLGGGRIPAELLTRARRLGWPIAPTYGLTEAASQVATLAPDQVRADETTVGPPLPGTRIRVVDEDGRECGPAAAGEIQVRGPQVMAGYLGRPDASRRALADGWLRTGDVGLRHPDGRLQILDRRCDLIVSGGENIYPAEVEQVLQTHPAVAEAAVIGRADAEWGQTVHAFIVPTPGHRLELADIARHCRAQLAGFKQPREIHLVVRLPRTASGKLRRGDLRTGS